MYTLNAQNIMIVQATADEFQSLSPVFRQSARSQVVWFKTEDDSIYATVEFDEVDADWTVIIATQEEDGIWKCAELDVGIPSRDDAIRRVRELMAKLWHPGLACSPDTGRTRR